MFPGGLTHAEVERCVESLQRTAPDQIGTPSWKTQRKNIELFNIISHRAAQRKSEDFVLSTLTSHEDKMAVLVHELLVAEAMRRNVYPKVLGDLAGTPAGLYLYVEYEGVLVNLLECLMYHEEAVTGLGDDVLDLIDYCWRSIASQFMATERIDFDPAAAEDAARVAALPAEERVQLQAAEGQMRRCMACISMLWFIVERIPTLPLAAVNRLLNKHDLLVGFANLIERHPWTLSSSSKSGRFYKFKNGRYEQTPVGDLPLVCAAEAHAWFALHYMLCDRQCRNRYQYNRFRKEQILRLKRFVNEVLVDQLPALSDVQRALEELSFLEPPAGTEDKFKQSMLLIDQVSALQTALENFRGWADLVANFKTIITKAPEAMRADAQCVSEIIDLMELETDDATAAAVAGASAADVGDTGAAVSVALGGGAAAAPQHLGSTSTSAAGRGGGKAQASPVTVVSSTPAAEPVAGGGAVCRQ